MTSQYARVLLTFAGLVLTPTVALADNDRPPTPEERTKVEAVLRTEGFTQWGKIEFEKDGKWEVDDAVSSDGRRYEVKLNQSLVIVERKLD